MSTGSETAGNSASGTGGNGTQQTGGASVDTVASNGQGAAAGSSGSVTKSKMPDLGFWFKVPVVATFIWIFFGISGIFGYFMWWNEPLRPPFVAFAVVAFSVVVSFSIVLSLQIVSGGDINVDIGGHKVAGPAGPVLFWVISFLAIMFGFSLVNMGEIIKSQTGPFKPITQLRPASASGSGTNSPTPPIE